MLKRLNNVLSRFARAKPKPRWQASHSSENANASVSTLARLCRCAGRSAQQAADATRRMSKNGTQLYRMVMTELEDRRLERGWPAWMLDDKAGVQDGYSQKMVHVDTPSGRQAGWQTVDLLMQALFPNGYRIKIIPENRGCFDASRQEAALAAYAAFYKGDRVLKDHMKSLRKRARNVGLKAVGKRRRKQIARAAAIARWRKPKITEIAG